LRNSTPTLMNIQRPIYIMNEFEYLRDSKVQSQEYTKTHVPAQTPDTRINNF